MSLPLVIVIGLFCVVVLIFVLLVFDPSLLGSRGGAKRNIKSIVSAQREIFAERPQPLSRTAAPQVDSMGMPVAEPIYEAQPKRKGKSIFETMGQVQKVERRIDSRLTLQKKLKFAQWSKFPPYLFNLAEILISVFVFFIVSQKFNILLQLLSLTSGPLFMRWLLTMKVESRFDRFDADYPSFLLSVIGLLKTGMNPMQALEAAASGMEDGSLVRQEVELMIERLRFGVPEERSIGSFGEDIFHPEIELFVQALLLSRRVGGNLSDTLDRLAKQVRKRQYFRKSARAAVGMQRGSIWVILGILGALEVYMYFVYPEAILGAWKDPLGVQVWQVGFAVILLGIFWVRQVTKIRT